MRSRSTRLRTGPSTGLRTGPGIVVVGAGHLGTFHADKIAELASEGTAELAAVVDIDPGRQAAASERFGVPTAHALHDVQPLNAQAAIIATPSESHAELAAQALDMGLHILVEKPLARDVKAARKIVALAAAADRLLQVGHTERFNPAVEAALKLAAPPCYIVAERLSPFSGRSTTDDVVLDLMIHDLDLVAAVVQSELVEVRAIGVPVLTGEVDMASVRLAFADGSVAQLSAGRASLEPSRKLRLFTQRRYLSVDCLNLEVKSVRRTVKSGDTGRPSICMEPVAVAAGDALLAQDRDFVRCVSRGEKPRVNGDAGVRAVELVAAIEAELTVPVAG